MSIEHFQHTFMIASANKFYNIWVVPNCLHHLKLSNEVLSFRGFFSLIRRNSWYQNESIKYGAT